MSAGAFSDAKVIQAAQSLTCVFIDCDWGRKNRDLQDRYRVSGYPSILFCDPEGKPIGYLEEREAEPAAKQIEQIAAKYNASADPRIAVPQITGVSFAQARVDAKRLSQPILFYFSDDSPGCSSVNLALADDSLKSTLSRFVFAKAEFRRNSDECLRFDVTRAPTLLVLDATLEKPEEKPLARIAGSRNVRELKRDLESALAGGNFAPAPAEAGPAKPAPAPRPFEEKLSDDEIERRFILARISVAKELIKQGKKPKGIETLEDIIKSYPKHLETLAAKRLLEEARR